MINKSEERKSDLRNTTVMEVILAVIIVLLCFIYVKDQDLFHTKNSVSILEKQVVEQKKKLKELKIDELKKIEPKLTNDVLKVFDLKNSINSKKSYGGTSFDNIKKMIMKYKK